MSTALGRNCRNKRKGFWNVQGCMLASMNCINISLRSPDTHRYQNNKALLHYISQCPHGKVSCGCHASSAERNRHIILIISNRQVNLPESNSETRGWFMDGAKQWCPPLSADVPWSKPGTSWPTHAPPTPSQDEIDCY